MRFGETLNMRWWAEWLALVLCTVSLVTYLYYSLAVAKYIQVYFMLLGKFARILVG